MTISFASALSKPTDICLHYGTNPRWTVVQTSIILRHQKRSFSTPKFGIEHTTVSQTRLWLTVASISFLKYTSNDYFSKTDKVDGTRLLSSLDATEVTVINIRVKEFCLLLRQKNIFREPCCSTSNHFNGHSPSKTKIKSTQRWRHKNKSPVWRIQRPFTD